MTILTEIFSHFFLKGDPIDHLFEYSTTRYPPYKKKCNKTYYKAGRFLYLVVLDFSTIRKGPLQIFGLPIVFLNELLGFNKKVPAWSISFT